MGFLDAPARPYRPNAVPAITSPTIYDSASMSIVGISQDRTTLYGSNQNPTTPDGQLYTSTDDGVTWSSGWLSNPVTGNVLDSAVETDSRELLITYQRPGVGRIRRTANWFARTSPASILAHTTLSTAASGNIFRHDWGIQSVGEITVACEYGGNTVSPSTNNARYAYLSKDDGETWATIFDIFSPVAGVGGAGIFPQNNFHTHSAIYDPWSGRVYVTHGDNNDGVWYSDDAANVEIIGSISTTNANNTITTTQTTRTTFTKLHEGKLIAGPGIATGTTISSVTDRNTAVLSANATATATGQVITVGPITWKPLHYGAGSHYQVVGMVPTPKGILIGSDGEPNGVLMLRRGTRDAAQPRLEVLKRITRAETAKSNVLLQIASYRAKDVVEAPTLMSFQGTVTGNHQSCLVLVHADGERAWNIWDDPWVPATGYESFISVYGPTASGNIVGTLQSTRTSSGFQTFRAPMPVLPT